MTSTARVKCPARKGVTHAPTILTGHCANGHHDSCHGGVTNGCGCVMACSCTHRGHEHSHHHEEHPVPDPTPEPHPTVLRPRSDQLTTSTDAPEDVVFALSQMAGRLNASLRGYGPDDWRDAARLLHRLRTAVATLRTLDADLVHWLYLHGEHGLHQTIDGIPGEVSITRGRSKERWAAPEAVQAYVEAQLAETGEVPNPLQVVAWVLEVVPATQSTSLRKTPLRNAGLDLEDFYSSEPGSLQVSTPS